MRTSYKKNNKKFDPYKLLNYKYLHSFTYTLPNTNINPMEFLDKVIITLSVFDKDVYMETAYCKNVKNGTHHNLKNRWHLHGVIAINKKIKNFHGDIYIDEIFDLSGWLDYIYTGHKISCIYETI